ncbi:MAG: hypothetical protein H6707_10585 [Deltaproteobacteria bacterium]|nr:hypothetical protein [Deltaproteobacteria bacterium]
MRGLAALLAIATASVALIAVALGELFPSFQTLVRYRLAALALGYGLPVFSLISALMLYRLGRLFGVSLLLCAALTGWLYQQRAFSMILAAGFAISALLALCSKSPTRR